MTSEIDFFDQAVKYALKNEGGYSDHKKDAGGPTNFGITQKTLSDWRSHEVSADEVKNLTLDEAKQIYYKKYWLPIACDKVTQISIAIAMFDVSVLFGTGVASVYSQKTLRNCNVEILVDGHIGPKSLAALNSIDAEPFVKTLRKLLMDRIEVVIAMNPENEVFRNGWENRVDRLQMLV